MNNEELSLFDVRRVNNDTTIYIFLDTNGNKIIKKVQEYLPIYVKNDTYINCLYFSKIDELKELKLTQKEIYNLKEEL